MTWSHITGDQQHMFVSSTFAVRVSPLILGYAADIICASVISLSLVFSRNRLNKLDIMHKVAKRHVSPSYAASSYSCLAGQLSLQSICLPRDQSRNLCILSHKHVLVT